MEVSDLSDNSHWYINRETSSKSAVVVMNERGAVLDVVPIGADWLSTQTMGALTISSYLDLKLNAYSKSFCKNTCLLIEIMCMQSQRIYANRRTQCESIDVVGEDILSLLKVKYEILAYLPHSRLVR